jgi:hypothetical protein
MIAVLIVGIGLGVGVPVWQMLRYDPVAAAVAQIESNQGKVIKQYDGAVWHGAYFCVDLSGQDLQNVDFSQIRVVSPNVIDLSNTMLSDEDLPKLYGSNAGQIILTNTIVTEAGIDALRAALDNNVEIIGPNGWQSPDNK